MSISKSPTLQVILHNECGGLGVERIGIFLHQCLGKIIDVQSESAVQKINDLKAVFRFLQYASRLATEIPSQSQGCQRDCRRGIFHKLPIKECDFHDESGNMLHFRIFHGRATTKQSEPCFRSWMPKSPLYSREHMSFHLNERRFFVCLAAYLY